MENFKAWWTLFNARLEGLCCIQQQSPLSRRGIRVENYSNLRPRERLDTADDCLCPNYSDRAQKLSYLWRTALLLKKKSSQFSLLNYRFLKRLLCVRQHITMTVVSNCVRYYRNVALFKKLFAVWFVLNKAGEWLARNLSCHVSKSGASSSSNMSETFEIH